MRPVLAFDELPAGGRGTKVAETWIVVVSGEPFDYDEAEMFGPFMTEDAANSFAGQKGQALLAAEPERFVMAVPMKLTAPRDHR